MGIESHAFSASPVGAASVLPLVLILQEHEAYREQLIAMVEAQGLEALPAADVGDALRLVRTRRVDMMVAAVPPNVQQALGLVMAMKETDPALDVIVLGAFERPEDEMWMLRQGLAFDVLRPHPSDHHALSVSIDVALRRKARLVEALLARAAPPAVAVVADPPPEKHPLTTKEADTLRLVSEGLENREIARKLVVSENTVRNNLARIYSKLGAENRTQAVNIARRLRVF